MLRTGQIGFEGVEHRVSFHREVLGAVGRRTQAGAESTKGGQRTARPGKRQKLEPRLRPALPCSVLFGGWHAAFDLFRLQVLFNTAPLADHVSSAIRTESHIED